MKNVNIEITLYEFNELNEKARYRAINEHGEFLMSVDEYEEARDEQSVIDSIECNGYLFFENGELAHTVCYTATHPTKPSVNEFIYMGKTYNF